MALVEPEIVVRSREELLYLLAEAAEIEHSLMCCYLFAAFGLKTRDDGLSEADAARIAVWRRALVAVAVEEMAHLSLVANLTMAIGAAPHFGRPNFPVAAGHYPSGVVVELRRFDRASLDHFIYLERPEGVVLPDGAGFTAAVSNYHRTAASDCLMPHAQDYLTVGHLYRGIRRGFVALEAKLGSSGLFVGDPALQVGPDLAGLPGIAKVTDLASARAALDTIVEQGEGSPADAAHSHYRRLIAIRDEYAAWVAREPGFEPSRPTAPNPVIRRPLQPDGGGKTYVDHPEAAAVMDLANAVYAAMLRTLAQGFIETEAASKRRFLDASLASMYALRPVAEHLTRLPASTSQNGLTAGMSFATLRDFGACRRAPLRKKSSRSGFVSSPRAPLKSSAPRPSPVPSCLRSQPSLRELAGETPAPPALAIETAEGKDIIIDFETKRCAHARFCVLQQPGVFKSNVVGPWLAPDDATSAEALIATAQNCPSGAVRYRRKDGGLEEGPPLVNLIQVRENGPLAVRAAIVMDGESAGFRAMLCRCGRSSNKPYCDVSHVGSAFAATGEPRTGDVTALAKRDGALELRPQKNGPLVIRGNVEVISGTGRAIRRAENLMLCRCGGSANKPYCDGTHARIGFIADA